MPPQRSFHDLRNLHPLSISSNRLEFYLRVRARVHAPVLASVRGAELRPRRRLVEAPDTHPPGPRGPFGRRLLVPRRGPPRGLWPTRGRVEAGRKDSSPPVVHTVLASAFS
jgi:hypothetical protein